MNPSESETAPRLAAIRFSCVLLAFGLSGSLLASPLSTASVLHPSPLSAPVIDACSFIPNPLTNISYDCSDPFAPYAFANVSVSFEVNVTDPTNATSSNMSVTFYFDYWSAIPVVNPDSPVRTINVSAPGNTSVVVNANWTYTAPNANFTGGQYFVNVNVTNEANESSEVLFRVYVAYNSPPSISIPSVNPVSEPIRPVDPVVPLLYENVTVFDPDGDPVTLTWDWGDGTRSVNTTEPLFSPLDLSVTHLYAAGFFPLNETPRNVDIPVQVWIDDGLGHNVSANSTAEFYLNFDAPPTARVDPDQPGVGSVWKVGEPVLMVGNVTDPEGSPTTAYWDFDNRTDSTSTGDPTRNRDADGTMATHTYTVPGRYNITLWATDGEKKLCLDSTCTNYTTHWTKAVVPIEVRNNAAPNLAVDPATGTVDTPTLLHAYVYDSDGDSMTVRWDFGDGTPEATDVTGTSPRGSSQGFSLFQEHIYTWPRSYTVTLHVDDGNSTTNLSENIFIESYNLPPVLLAIDVNRENGTPAGNNTFVLNELVVISVRVYDDENDTLSLSVDWADGTFDNRTLDPKSASECYVDDLSRKVCTVSFAHAYGDIGADEFRGYLVLVSATDNRVYLLQNATGGPPISMNHTKTQGVAVAVVDSGGNVAPLGATIAALPTIGTIPLVVSFNAVVSGGTPPYAYDWDFGDGGSSTQRNTSHTYREAGNYSASVTVTDSQGRTVTRRINVTANPGPVTGPNSQVWIFAAIVAVGAVGAAALVALGNRGGRRQQPPPPQPPS